VLALLLKLSVPISLSLLRDGKGVRMVCWVLGVGVFLQPKEKGKAQTTNGNITE
jgi:hypothetical protein